ncbi:MAG: hypothetical protein GC137_00560 [Alphaproteobacteria bacterium]|nr:hypothetical protein [Alphaproteobacteria bacterium]
MANQFLALSLFLMLLSFFIVLNAISGYEQTKTEPVIKSISLTFSSEEKRKEQEVSKEPTPVAASKQGDTMESLEGLFNAHIAGFQVSRNRLGTIMHVRSDVKEFEKAINIQGGSYDQAAMGEQGSFAQTLVTLLRSEEEGKSYSIDMYLNTPEDPAEYQKEFYNEFMRDLRQVTGFADRLEDVGLPKRMISAGLAKGDIGYIDLFFYKYKPFDMMAAIKEAEEQPGSGR